MERRKKDRPIIYDVIDVDLAHVFYAGPDATEADSFKCAIEMQGHRVIMKEIKC